MSTQIRPGSTWIAELLDGLSGAGACIVCVTAESVPSSWLAFEAGMLSARGLETPILAVCLDVEPGALDAGPLGPLTRLSIDAAGIEALRRTLDRDHVGAEARTQATQQHWQLLAARLAEIPKAPTRPFDLVFWTRAGLLTAHDVPLEDGSFSEELSRIVKTLGDRLPVRDLTGFRCLDLVSDRWFDRPALLSSIHTSRFALIDPEVVTGYEASVASQPALARMLTFLIKNSLDVTPLQHRAFHALQRDIRALADRQETFRKDARRYGTLDELVFYLSPGIRLETFDAGPEGWSTVATHEILADYYAYRVGDGAGRFASAEEGKLVKAQRS
jgi:hypothetical protein